MSIQTRDSGNPQELGMEYNPKLTVQWPWPWIPHSHGRVGGGWGSTRPWFETLGTLHLSYRREDVSQPLGLGNWSVWRWREPAIAVCWFALERP